MITSPCSDCGFATQMTAGTLKKGSSIREPGESLCLSCSAKRVRMVRELEAIPDKLDQIKALRMVRGAA